MKSEIVNEQTFMPCKVRSLVGFQSISFSLEKKKNNSGTNGPNLVSFLKQCLCTNNMWQDLPENASKTRLVVNSKATSSACWGEASLWLSTVGNCCFWKVIQAMDITAWELHPQTGCLTWPYTKNILEEMDCGRHRKSTPLSFVHDTLEQTEDIFFFSTMLRSI